MSKQPRIVAELGRPETPEETAQRKAASRKRHFQNQNLTNLVLALFASLALVLVIVLVVLRPDPAPPEPIDVSAHAAEADTVLGAEPIVPAMPDTWSANAAEVRMSTDEVATWYVGYVTADNQFVAMTQGVDANATWQANQLRNATPDGEVTIDGVQWQMYDQRDTDDVGNLEFAMTTQVDNDWIVLFGTAQAPEFTQFAEAVSAAL